MAGQALFRRGAAQVELRSFYPRRCHCQKWPDRQSWTKYFRNMVQPSRWSGLSVLATSKPAPKRRVRNGNKELAAGDSVLASNKDEDSGLR
ncbi:hypothetical protein SETIT_6G080900v2 [Setaria italica]|uniref:Uncharacterized protein n=1 Tax=Setaria italica TaxID=4555 RepID=A0A368RKZ6_SETIT|nr:hypothetical protein SETIT_6G080900v2 [Setaria italica]